MTGLDRIRACMTEFLEGRGVRAVTAWPAEGRKKYAGPVAAVSLREVKGGPGGFQDYLGERFDRDSGRWQELYGKRVRVVFGLDLYSPRAYGAAGCQEAFDRLAEALEGEGPAGLSVRDLSRGETEFLQDGGLFRCPAEAVCEAYLYAVADEGGGFLDFEVKGVPR